MSPLYALMHKWAAEPFVWGQTDCALCLADWFGILYGGDPAAHLRGRYFDAQSCHRVSGWFTDPVAVIEGCLDTVRTAPGQFPRGQNAPARGDVAVIQIPGEGRIIPAGAIWLGTVWGVKGPDGATTISPRAAQPLEIWGIGHAE